MRGKFYKANNVEYLISKKLKNSISVWKSMDWNCWIFQFGFVEIIN